MCQIIIKINLVDNQFSMNQNIFQHERNETMQRLILGLSFLVLISPIKNCFRKSRWQLFIQNWGRLVEILKYKGIHFTDDQKWVVIYNELHIHKLFHIM